MLDGQIVRLAGRHVHASGRIYHNDGCIERDQGRDGITHEVRQSGRVREVHLTVVPSEVLDLGEHSGGAAFLFGLEVERASTLGLVQNSSTIQKSLGQR